MSKSPASIGEKTLKSLQNWRELRLDVARVEHEQARTLTDARQQAVDTQQQKIDESNATMRAQLTENTVISVDALTRIRHFTLLTLDDLRQAQDSLQQARTEQNAAHAELVKKAADKRAVERLREKRKALSERDRSQREQKQMDDQAAVRYARELKEMQDSGNESSEG